MGRLGSLTTTVQIFVTVLAFYGSVRYAASQSPITTTTAAPTTTTTAAPTTTTVAPTTTTAADTTTAEVTTTEEAGTTAEASTVAVAAGSTAAINVASTAAVEAELTTRRRRRPRPRPPRVPNLFRCLRYLFDLGRLWRCIVDEFRPRRRDEGPGGSSGGGPGGSSGGGGGGGPGGRPGGRPGYSLEKFKMSFWDILKLQKLHRRKDGSDKKYMQKLLDRSA